MFSIEKENCVRLKGNDFDLKISERECYEIASLIIEYFSKSNRDWMLSYKHDCNPKNSTLGDLKQQIDVEMKDLNELYVSLKELRLEN